MHLYPIELLDDGEQQHHDGLLVVLAHPVADADVQDFVLQVLLRLR